MSRDQLQVLISELRAQGYRCVGPQVRDGAIVYDSLKDCTQLPQGVSEQQSPGSYQLSGNESQRYFAWANGPQAIKPYVGAFYRRTYIENLPDLESVGGRAGIYMSSGNNVYISIGGVFESYLNCEETTYRSCDESYPELGITFAF